MNEDDPGFLLHAPTEQQSLAEIVRARIGPALQALLLFGSCLSPELRQPGSIPDLLALVDDLDAALRGLGCGALTRVLGRTLPPITLALADPARDRAIAAKLNLISSEAARRSIAALPDLYLAGRLSKPVALLWSRDASSADAARALHKEALAQVIEQALRGLRGGCSMDAAVDAVITLSYRAEVRPEGPEKLQALRRGFPSFYSRTVPAAIEAAAPRLGFMFEPGPQGGAPRLRDVRDPARRAADLRALERLLRRSRRRAVLRWPRQLLIYRGAIGYVLGKLRRVRSQRETP